MSHTAFDQHECPALVGPPKDGESWADYKARSDAFAAAYHATTPQPQETP